MARADLDVHFAKIDEMVREIEALVPPVNYQNIQFRADLAGLLVVAMAATYETCVKEVLFESANRTHSEFGNFASRNFAKLNSRIKVSDLSSYCGLYDPTACANFKSRLKERKKAILDRSGKNIETSYQQILDWRHDFAHARVRNTTIEEATATHRVAKRVLYIFDQAMNPT